LRLVRDPIPLAELDGLARETFGDMVKAVIDVYRRIMAIGAELHSDEEAALIDDGSRQSDLWGINLYPSRSRSERIEFDSLINIRPSQGNRSRDVQDATIRATIEDIVDALILE
jgi:Protein of unknown function (DUF5674)